MISYALIASLYVAKLFDDKSYQNGLDYINEIPASHVQQEVLLDTLKGIESSIHVDLSDAAAVKSVSKTNAQNTTCLAYYFDSSSNALRYLKNIEWILTETRERKRRFYNYNAARSGTVQRLPDFSICKSVYEK